MPRKPKAPKPEEGVEEFSLYGGEVRMLYKDSSHRYRVSVAGSKPVQVPSVTTILNVLNKPALVEWGVRCACDYVYENLQMLFAGNSFSVEQIFKVVQDARTAHDRTRQEAADIGTNVHDWLSRYWWSLQQPFREGPDWPKDEKEQKCIQAALKWFGEHDLKPVRIEEAQYSRLLEICGRPDFIGHIDGQLSVLDYKSTKFIYPEVCLQMTAYAMMHQEEFGQLPAARWALRLDKETGEFEDRKFKPETFDLDQETFRACFLIYDRLKHLRRKEKKDFLEGL